MSGAALTFTIDDAASGRLESAALRATDARFFLDNVGAYLDSDVTRRFIAGTEPDGTPWTPSQRALNDGGRTLVDTGNLMAGVTHNVEGNDAVEHGLTAIYGAIHHFGGKTGRGHKTTIEARPIIGITPVQQPRIDKLLTRFMRSWFE